MAMMALSRRPRDTADEKRDGPRACAEDSANYFSLRL
jgi:hypothetical protein